MRKKAYKQKPKKSKKSTYVLKRATSKLSARNKKGWKMTKKQASSSKRQSHIKVLPRSSSKIKKTEKPISRDVVLNQLIEKGKTGLRLNHLYG